MEPVLEPLWLLAPESLLALEPVLELLLLLSLLSSLQELLWLLLLFLATSCLFFLFLATRCFLLLLSCCFLLLLSSRFLLLSLCFFLSFFLLPLLFFALLFLLLLPLLVQGFHGDRILGTYKDTLSTQTTSCPMSNIHAYQRAWFLVSRVHSHWNDVELFRTQGVCLCLGGNS